MRHLTLLAAGIILVGASGNAGAFPAAKSRIDNSSNIQLVQDTKSEKSDTLKNRVKRVWKDLTGYKFDVACPGFWLPANQSICTETGKNRQAARSKCEAQHALCQIRDADRSGSKRRTVVSR
jgi:hypothetical protein